MTVKSGVSINKFVESINNELALKQDLLTAGKFITIKKDDATNKLVIDATYDPVPFYATAVESKDFTDDSLTISAKAHNCGTTPVLRYIQEGSDDNGWENVVVGVKMDKVGNVTLEANPFNGRLLFVAPIPKADDVQSMTNNILTGSVTA